MNSVHGSDFGSSSGDEDQHHQTHDFPIPAVWQRQERLSQKLGNAVVHVAELRPRTRETTLHRRGSLASSRAESEDDHHSKSSTLAEEEHDDYEYPEKTPTFLPPAGRGARLAEELEEPSGETEWLLRGAEGSEHAQRAPGPLEQQLTALMSKIVLIEKENPTVSFTTDDYAVLEGKVNAFKEEKETWAGRHEALFALRDEDISNIINIRGLLAAERREHAAMCKLRDEDIANVIELRGRLADLTWKLEKASTGSSTPSGRPKSMMLARRDTTDLFQAAKHAALEQRTLELERANGELMTQIEEMKQQNTIKSTEGLAVVEATLRAQLGAAERANDELILDNTSLRTRLNLACSDGTAEAAERKVWQGVIADLGRKLKQKEDEIARLHKLCIHLGTAFAANF